MYIGVHELPLVSEMILLNGCTEQIADQQKEEVLCEELVEHV